MLLKGETHERLNEVSSALADYAAVVSGYAGSSDAEIAEWRVEYLTARTTHTVGSAGYESAMAVHRQHVLDDMRGSSGGPHKRGDEDKAYAGESVTAGLMSLVPNPSDGEVTIGYELGTATAVRIVVVDALGRELAEVERGARSAGTHSIRWDGRALEAGVYYVRLEWGGQVQSLPLVVVK